MKKVLIALDYSGATIEISRRGAELAAAFDAQLILTHVLSDITYYTSLNYSPILGFDSFSNMDVLQSDTADEVRKAAHGFLERCRTEVGWPQAEIIVGEGDFAEEILKVAAEKGADVIVMGSHSRKGIDKIFMGSVAEKVLHRSNIPVYIIPIRNS